MGGGTGACGGGTGEREVATWRALLAEHAALRRDLIGILRGAADVDLGPAVTMRSEERAADLAYALEAHGFALAEEGARRGKSVETVRSEFAASGGDGCGPEFADALESAFPDGPADARLVRWRSAADEGRPAAQYVRGLIELHASPTAEAAEHAVAWIRRAADAGLGPALADAASFERDPVRAGQLLRRAAAAGIADACRRIVVRARGAHGEPLSVSEAIELLEMSAKAGDAEAQLELGRIRATGDHGLPIDFEAARRWIGLAAKQHRLVAHEWLEKFAALDADTYRDAIWVESWTPTDLPPPPRAGKFAVVVSIGLLALLVAGAVNGSSVGLFLILMFVAIVMHEAGHFLAARLVGVPIQTVTLGAGPLLASIPRRSGPLPMRIDLRLLPLLGSVQPYVAPRAVWRHWTEQARCAADGDAQPAPPKFDAEDEPRPVFHHVSKGRRVAFLSGGLAVNFLTALAAFWIYENASPEARLVTAPVAGRVPAGSVAAATGLREGDRFVAVDGRPVVGFFDVRRRLAPVADDGAATAPPDPPGRGIRVDVIRDGRPVALTWTTPAAPPDADAAEAYGLFPTDSWRVARIRRDAACAARAGDEVTGFASAGRTIAAAAPGAHAALREALAQGSVELQVGREGRVLTTVVEPWRRTSGAAGEAPFEFERLREPRAPAGPGEVLGRVGRVGWRSLIALPSSIVASFRDPPSREEQGWIVAAVRRDPWQAFDLFGFIHAFLLFLNFVPIPPLDGFQIAWLGVETVRRKPLPRAGVAWVMKVGWVLLAAWIALNAILILRDAVSAVV